MAKPLPSIVSLQTLLRYEPETGKLYWRERDSNKFNAQFAGKEAGYLTSKGYLHVRIYGEAYYAHRIAFAMFHGRDLEGLADHKNGDRADNRIDNLREVSHIVNARNSKKISRNKSGVTGVHFVKKYGNWRAKISGKSLGSFETFEEAVEARRNAEKALGFSDRHGK